MKVDIRLNALGVRGSGKSTILRLIERSMLSIGLNTIMNKDEHELEIRGELSESGLNNPYRKIWS
jgi:hypothetical protein